MYQTSQPQVLEDWARHFMWKRIEGETGMDRNEVCKPEHWNCQPCEVRPLSYDYEAAQEHMKNLAAKWQDRMIYMSPQVEETRNDMYNQASATIAVTAVKDNSLSYVKDRLDKINWRKVCEIREKFQTPYPKDVKEAKKWLAEGYLYFHSTSDEESDYCGWEWGKDTSKESLAAHDALKKAYADAYDTVSIMSDETVRLKALQDFEAFVVA